MLNRKIARAVMAAGVVAAAASVAMADVPGGDILLSVSGGHVATGLISEDGLTTTPGVRVFYSEFGEDAPDFVEDPGLRAADGAFDPGSSLSFMINRALRQWDGASFSRVAGAISIDFGALNVTTPATDIVVPGFSLVVGPLGGLHDHPGYTLQSPASDGLYLLDVSFSSSMSGVGTGAPVWILFGQNADPVEAQAAYDWATANVPAPGGALLLGATVVGASLRRRR